MKEEVVEVEWVLHKNPSHEKISVHKDYESERVAMLEFHFTDDCQDVGIEPIAEFE